MLALFHHVAEALLSGLVRLSDRLVNFSCGRVVWAIHTHDTLLVRSFDQMLSPQLALVGPFRVLKLGHPLDPLVLLRTPLLVEGTRDTLFVLVEVRESLSFGWQTILSHFFKMCSFLLSLPIQETSDSSIISLIVGEAEEFSFVGAREELGHLGWMLPPNGPERGSRPGPLRRDPDCILEFQRVGPFRRRSDCGSLGVA